MTEQREKNSIFTQEIQQQQTQQGDQLLPAELAPLPSNGLVYDQSSSLFGRESLEIYPMTAREEDILTNKVFLKKGTVITELIKSCLVDKSVEPRNLLVGDRNAITVAIRVTGYGAEYSTNIACSECDTKFDNEFDLSQLSIRRLSIKPLSPGLNRFEFTLPYSKKVVHFQFTTGKIEEELSELQTRLKKIGPTASNSVTAGLISSIVSIDGNENKAEITAFVNSKKFRACDSLALRNYIRSNEPGIIMEQEVECPSCNNKEVVSIPFGITFLWPNAS